MKKNLIMLIVPFLVFCCSKTAKIEETENGLKITKNRIEVNARIVEDENTQQYFVVSCDIQKFLFCDGSLGIIPLEKAESLRNGSGNFMYCNNPGSKSAKASVKSSLLILKNPEGQDVLKNIIKLKDDNKYPVVELTSTEIKITNCKESGMNIQLDDKLEKNLLVDSIAIIEDNFKFED